MKSYQLAGITAVSALWVLLSYGEVFKILGFRAGIVLCIVFPILATAAFTTLRNGTGHQHRSRVAATLAGGWIFAAVAYVFLHPLSQRHVFGQGSDRENAIEVACSTLLAGHFPYRNHTFLGNPITPMPGALLFAAPFYLLGQIGVQNLFWLAIFLYWCYRFWSRGWLSAWYAFVFVLFSPCIMQDVVTGGDFFTNFVYVIVLLSVVVYSLAIPRWKWSTWIWPLVLGIALSSRPIYSVVYPCLLAITWQIAGRSASLITVALTAFAELGVTIPIYLHDPAHFTPFNVGSNAYSLIPAAYMPAVLTFVVGLLIASASFFLRLDLQRLVGILGCSLTVITLPFFVIDRIVKPELFPLINLIYLAPGLLLLIAYLLRRYANELATDENSNIVAPH
ncbi:MAG TPA: hypothetical protein VF018_05470 [Acidobacteriaceae bacterium]